METLQAVLIPVLLIFFLGAFIRSTFGFGDALIEMPLLALIISLKIATPIVAAFGVVLALAILIREWKHINFHSTWRLILSSAIGIPFGVYYLHIVPEFLTKVILGIILILIALLNMFYPKQLPSLPQPSAYGFGFLAGILGSAYNTNGPPIILYSLTQKWNPATFRATMQSYFLPVNTLIIISHISSGLWQKQTFLTFLIALPVVLLASLLGTLVAKRIEPERFNKAIYAIVLLMGCILIYSIF